MTRSRMLVLAWLALAAAGLRCGGRTPDAETAAVPPGPAPQADAQVPPEILGALDTCSISVSLLPVPAGAEDPGPGLRNVSLYVPQVLLEPPGVWADGTPVGADLHLSAETARALLEVLAAHGFFARAVRRHSEARPTPATPPPADSVAGLPERAAEPNLELTVRVHDEDWHSLRIASWPLGDPARELLRALEQAAGAEAADALAALRASF